MKLRRILLLALLAASHVYADESPRQIVGHTRAVYATLRSYTDSGVVLSHIREGEQPSEITFRSAFVRPQWFRFEWVTHHPYPPLRHLTHNSVIWSNPGGVYLWTDVSGKDAVPQKRQSFALAVASATGVSLGAAHTIASLLVPDAGGGGRADAGTGYLA